MLSWSEILPVLTGSASRRDSRRLDRWGTAWRLVWTLAEPVPGWSALLRLRSHAMCTRLARLDDPPRPHGQSQAGATVFHGISPSLHRRRSSARPSFAMRWTQIAPLLLLCAPLVSALVGTSNTSSSPSSIFTSGLAAEGWILQLSRSTTTVSSSQSPSRRAPSTSSTSTAWLCWALRPASWESGVCRRLGLSHLPHELTLRFTRLRLPVRACDFRKCADVPPSSRKREDLLTPCLARRQHLLRGRIEQEGDLRCRWRDGLYRSGLDRPDHDGGGPFQLLCLAPSIRPFNSSPSTTSGQPHSARLPTLLLHQGRRVRPALVREIQRA